jgi:hypothetical protein
MALLKRELYHQVKGPEITRADRCALVFDTDAKTYTSSAKWRLRARSTYKRRQWILQTTSNKADKLPGTASFGGRTLFKEASDTDELID